MENILLERNDIPLERPMMRPILFTAENVRAILEDRKRQTRRIFKPERMEITTHAKGGYWYSTYAKRAGQIEHTGSGPFIPNDWLHYCPYGQPGDRVWVRETFRAFSDGDVFYRADFIQYGSDYIPVHADDEPEDWRWTPSIYMPRKQSRILLEIENVRVERVQDISEEDARAEGCEFDDGKPPEGYSEEDRPTARQEYKFLWDKINAEREVGNTWAKNPWFWVLGFRVYSKEGELMQARCIARDCGKQFDTNTPELRQGITDGKSNLRSFWQRYCPECRTKGNAGSEVITERKSAAASSREN
jgi:hypothetical protein